MVPEIVLDIHSEFPEISNIWKYGGGAASRGVTCLNMFSPMLRFLVGRLINKNVENIRFSLQKNIHKIPLKDLQYN